jgi:hypothetical protein
VVLAVDCDRLERGPKGRLVHRPRVDLLSPDPCPFPRGTRLWWTEREGVEAEVLGTTPEDGGTRVRLRVHKGHGRGGVLPGPGEHVVFSSYGGPRVPLPSLPAEVPWTHRPDEEAA